MSLRHLAFALVSLAASLQAADEWSFATWQQGLQSAARIESTKEIADAWKAANPKDSEMASALLHRWVQLDASGAFASLIAEGDLWHAEEALYDWANMDPTRKGFRRQAG